ncbi:PilZ domain-containing protein [Plasticicumulans sp.]|uniref:PilZ domain-containing protein n=1 Tax=Plasticicumulans sp. TaxID=2307179 RepID=UPI002BDDEDE3|nr:PilZ domain-containing protein [Plasticicumulans sp.]MBS0602157.1 PilZ domain-containing protein [Pseudomonadota bacterium]HMV38556.1 PilZ domain-containing protein [Plasticicumulans sp.]HMW31315.1 PilZ domain-containing protein [Plasticicumulans sp.]HMX54232.1 PilZ domain-containing protein [Plasticicumulans sp.]HMZ10606.1 PilZ domain-containing protein [Plasticicumulans sp.]
MSNERRLFTRIPFVANVEVVIDGVPHPAELHDISLMGVLVRVDDGASAALDTPVHVLLALDTERTVVIATHGRIVHNEDGRLGCRFDQVDLDSMIHLRRLMELNLGDAERIKREIYEMVRLPEGQS